MKRIILAVVLLGVTAGPAFAKDLCVENIFGQLLKFDNVKLLKGKTTVLVGRFHPAASDTNTPVNGVLTVDSDNVTTRIGIVSFPIGAVSSVGWTMTGDKSLNATGNFDNNPFSGNDGADTWTSISCASPFPPASSIAEDNFEITGDGPVPGLR